MAVSYSLYGIPAGSSWLWGSLASDRPRPVPTHPDQDKHQSFASKGRAYNKSFFFSIRNRDTHTS